MTDVSCEISELRALADTLVCLDRYEEDLYSRAAPWLIRIIAEKAEALEQRYEAPAAKRQAA